MDSNAPSFSTSILLYPPQAPGSPLSQLEEFKLFLGVGHLELNDQKKKKEKERKEKSETMDWLSSENMEYVVTL